MFIKKVYIGTYKIGGRKIMNINNISDILKFDTQTVNVNMLEEIKNSSYVLSVKALGNSKLKSCVNCYSVELSNNFSIMVYCKD